MKLSSKAVAVEGGTVRTHSFKDIRSRQRIGVFFTSWELVLTLVIIGVVAMCVV